MKTNNKRYFEASNQRTHFKRTRKIMGIPIGWMILIIGSFVTTGALIGIAFNFSIIQTTSVQTQGVYTPEMYFDGVVMDQEEYAAPSDVFSDGVLAAGEEESFTHTLMSPVTDGDWDVAWSVYEFMPFVNMHGLETDPSYGYMFNVTNAGGTNISYMTVMHGETKTINFIHGLNSHFDQDAAPVGGIPFKLSLHVYPYVTPPTCNPDVVSAPWRVNTDVYALANDEGAPLTITGVSGGESGDTITISPDNQYVIIYQNTIGTVVYNYTVTSGAPLFKSGSSTITVTAA